MVVDIIGIFKKNWIKGVIVLGAFVVGWSSHYLVKKDDNIIEETSENIIKNHVGLDIDLTPESSEKNLE